MKKLIVLFVVLILSVFVLASCGTRKAHQHSPAEIIENVVEATCTSDGGYDTVTYCTECNEEISRVRQTVAMAHGETTERIENVVEATCTSQGSYDEVVYCQDCSEELSRNEITVEKLHHHVIAESKYEVEACGVDGVYTVQYCISCKNIVSAVEGTLHAHDYERLTDELGWYFKCKNCGHEYRNSKINDYENAYESHNLVLSSYNSPTCTRSGSAVLSCTKCDYWYKYTIYPLGHDFEVKTVILEPTCTEAGKNLLECSRCDATDYDYPEALGHNYAKEVFELSESCIEEGTLKLTCRCCGEVKFEPYYADHDYPDWTCVQEENCTQLGIYTRTCTVCEKLDMKIVQQRHQFDDGVVTTEPTCTEKGIKSFTCELCGYVSNEDIDALGHSWKTVSEKAPTCTQSGYCIKLCSRCGETDATYYNSRGHNMVYRHDDEKHWQSCTRCTLKTEEKAHTLTLVVKTVEVDDGTQIMYSHTLVEECEVCGYENIFDTAELHIHYAVETFGGVEPSCTDGGYAPGLRCAVEGCKEVLIEPAFINALGHSWEKGNCSRCGETQLKMELSDDGSYYIVAGIGQFKGKELEIPSTYKNKPVKEVGAGAFYRCTSLTSVTIGNGVTSIGGSAFENCDSLTSIVIPDSVTSIGNYAFQWCASLKSIEIPDSVTSIGYWAFDVCTALTSVTIGNGVTSIGDYAFSDCTSLTSIEIPDSVTSIGKSAFCGCTSLTSVTIGNGVTSIGNDAFYNCTSLTSITVNENNNNYKSIDGNLYSKGGKTLIRYAIGKAATFFAIPDSVTSIGGSAFENCDRLTSVEIPDSVTRIVDYAFGFCKSLTSIVIPDSVTSIGTYAFHYCTSLTSITVNENNSVYKSIDGNLYRKDGKTLIRYATGKAATFFAIPDSVTSIGDSAFSDCTSLTSVVIPDSVTSIGNDAFYGCTSLTSIVIPDSVTSIAYAAFSGCISLTSIVIPDSVTRIGDYAFGGCDSITIYCEAGSKPSGWASYWNFDNRPVEWGYTGE